jgi:hypothetical protein
MGLRIAVQQQQRWPGPLVRTENLRAVRLDGDALGEAGEEVGDDVHGAPFSHARATALQPMSAVR